MNALQSQIQVIALIVAAGSGRRMGAAQNKVWLSLNGKTILEHTLNVFCSSPRIVAIQLVVNPLEIEQFQDFLAAKFVDSPTSINLVGGGPERQDSVANGLRSLENWSDSASEQRLVAIHDAARPLLTGELLESALLAGAEYKAVGLGLPVKDTIKMVDETGLVCATPNRAGLWLIQTPQVFDLNLIQDCYRRIAGSGLQFSDDCSVVEHCGHPVKLIRGSYENIKITTPEDLAIAETFLRRAKLANRSRL